MDAEVVIASVKTNQTRNGNTRWTVRDDQDREYTTFREEIGRAAEAAEGSPARIRFHEDERNGFRNVYLDEVQPLRASRASSGAAAGGGAADSDPEEAFEKLKPFKDLVSEDIRSGPSEPDRND